MKRAFIMAVLAGSMTFSSRASAPVPPFDLNGMTSLPGFRCACFAAEPAAGGRPVNFMLSDGEARYGLRLLKIEPAAGRVEIEYGGQTQYLHICSAPILSPADESAPNAADDFVNPADSNGGPEVVDGNPSPALAARLAASLPGDSGSGGPEGNGGADRDDKNVPNDPDPATTLKAQADTDWYQQSVGIEQSRIADAQAVLSGEQGAWPRTPLTPAGTPAGLIGNDTLFPSHIPGFYR